jgi:hypothetical protein
MAVEFLINSYVTLEEANAYLSDRSAKWVDASTEARERALVQATAMLDEQSWLGQAVDADQPLAWPRLSFSYYDHSLSLVIRVAEGEIPKRLKTGVFNQALHVLTYPDLFEGSGVQDFESIRVGPISIEDRDTNQNRSIPMIPYQSVRKVIGPLLGQTSARLWWRAN